MKDFATPLSWPALVRNDSGHRRAIAVVPTLPADNVWQWPCDFACFKAAKTSVAHPIAG